MSKLKSTNNKIRDEFQEEKIALNLMQKDLYSKRRELKDLISDLHYEINKKAFLIENDAIDASEKSMLKYDLTLSKRQLEKSIYEKELLNKDIGILQYRIKQIENDVKKATPWWKRVFNTL
ncbi:MAG: hypothetical protein AB7V50_01230 [Vampirovibrionia bacterium]